MTGSNIVADTNIFIDLMKGDKGIAYKLELFDQVFISPVVLAELYFGAHRSANPQKHLDKVESAIQRTTVLAMDANTSRIFVNIKLSLFAKGKPIPENDIWIAASALQYQLPVYTNDSHFADIDGIILV